QNLDHRSHAIVFSFYIRADRVHREPHSFPTRRSSDLHSRAPSKWTTASRSRAASTIPVSSSHVGSRNPASRSGSSRISAPNGSRSEEHTSELQSRENLVCRLLLEKKNMITENNLPDA